MGTARIGRNAAGGLRRGRQALAGLLAIALIAACTSGDDGAAPESTTTTAVEDSSPDGNGTGTGEPGGPAPTRATLGLRLSQGQPVAPTDDVVEVVEGETLDADAVAAVIARLPEWSADRELAEEFSWPAESLAPPRAGATVEVAFPAAESTAPDDVPTGPLSVVRFQPEGEVRIAPFVTITFDQPMVPLGTVGQVAAAAVPATISPELTGEWQWIGTRTLRFDASSDTIDRLPMATDYRVAVPAGTTSATGGALAEEVSFEFSTPPAQVLSFTPQGESLPLEPTFVAMFDQRIDPAAVLATISLDAGGDRRELRLATAEEIEADDAARAATQRAPEGRWLAFRPVEPLPADATLDIAIGPGTPSAEGPAVTPDAQEFEARTYPPLTVKERSCHSGNDCPPGSPLVIWLSNPLLAGTVDPAAIGVEPAVPGMVVSSEFGSTSISILGATVARTTYTVTLPAGLTDVFGQTLGEDVAVPFEIGSAAPRLDQLASALTTLDPLADGDTLAVRTVNHDELRVRMFSVTPDDWDDYQRYFYDSVLNGDDAVDLPDWDEVSDEVVGIDDGDDRLVETSLDLSAALDGRPGHVVVLVELTDPYPRSNDLYWSNRPTITWVQSTAIGLDAFTDPDDLLAWTTDLRTGAPLSGVEVGFEGEAASKTGSDGLTTVALAERGDPILVARLGDDSALLPAGFYGELFQQFPVADEPRWYVFDDRQIYRPGETVSMKGWIRRLTSSGESRLVLPDAGATVAYTVRDPQYVELTTGTATLTELGGFDLSFELPDGANLGYASVEMALNGVPGLSYNGYSHGFQIQEFRRPEFEVTARPETPGPYVSDRPATVAVDANYYAGGPLGAAPVAWQVTTTDASYSPPGWDEFSFGTWIPWWISDFGGGDAVALGGYSAIDSSEPCCGPGIAPEVEVEEFVGTTDANGSHYLQIDFVGSDGARPDLPVTVSSQAAVTDVNRQTWAAQTDLLVHPAELYVGLRSDRAFVRQGDPLRIEVIATDIDGAAVADRTLTVVAARLHSRYVNGTWTEEEIDPQNCEVVSAAEPVPCEFDTSVGGTYRMRAVITDDTGGSNRTELTAWVSGGDEQPSRNVEQEALTIVPDQERYEVGTTASLLVQAPFEGEGIAVISHGGISDTVRFTSTDGSAVVEIPITEDSVPNVDVTMELVGAAGRLADDGTELVDAPKRPAYATGSITLPVSTATRTLTVTAVPGAEVLEPGSSTTLDVTVAGPDGNPVEGAEFSVVVVDEAVLAVGGYTMPDPLEVFYGRLSSNLSVRYGRQTIELANPDTLVQEEEAASETTAAASADGAGSGEDPAAPAEVSADASNDSVQASRSGEASGSPIAERTDFAALAVFEPTVITDTSGRASVDVPLPDNLTRYRVMVVAGAGNDRFGSVQANITARLPLMVRPSAPRFANFGDSFELPVVVQNQTDQPMEVDVVLQTANLRLDGPAGRRVTLAANDRVEVRFPVGAEAAGTARFRVAGISGDDADAAVVELPVYNPSTAEAFATYGVLDEGATVQPVLAPIGVIPQFGGLEITTSSTSLQALTDAVLYLSEYPYRSSDALAGRIMAIAALRDVLEAFSAEGLPSAEELDRAVSDDIARLTALQNGDGGFPFWAQFRKSEPFNSIQATHALVLARGQGYTVPEQTLAMALGYLSSIEQYYPSEYSEEIRDSLSAYALHVRNLAGDADPGKAQEIWDRRGEELQLDAVAWLWPVIADPATSDEMARLFSNRAVETAGAANFATSYGDDAYVLLHSDRRTDGIVLDALIAERPDSDLIPKVVAGLLGGQTKGRWDNVQENAFILLALHRYFETYEAQTPDFVARIWLGERFAGDQSFVGRSTDRVRITVPTAELIATGDTDIVVSKQGSGRLYYRLGLRTAPDDLTLDPLDRGFVVDRIYEAVDDPADVARDDDGTWRIKAGARVRVRLTMVAESQRTHAALIDPLPAGLEILNPALATTPDVPDDPALLPDGGDDWSWWMPTWFDHQNQRDDRAEAFAAWLPAGSYDYTYVARATTPGTFVAPPTRAEEIYAPETFGRGSTDRVVIAP